MRSNDFTPTLILPHQGGGEVFCRLPADEHPNPSPCRRGLFSLQWACVIGPDSIEARVFERGEGPTLSSGSSATAVASAARKLALLDAKTVNVRMPGGVAPVQFDVRNGSLERVMLFGE